MQWVSAIRRWELWVPLTIVLLGCFGYVTQPLVLQTARHTVFDQFQRWQPRIYQPVPVHIVDIDDESLKRLGQWPWPRDRMAELTQTLHASGAAVVAFDMVFSEADRTSPAAILHRYALPPALRQTLEQMPDPDESFAMTLRGGPSVLGFALDRNPATQVEPPALKAQLVAINESALPYVPAFVGSVAALPGLVQAAQGHGALSFVPDGDGVVRRVPMLVRQDNRLLPSFATEALRVALGVKNIITRTAGPAGLEEIRLGTMTVPTNSAGEVWIHYAPRLADRYIPAWKILAGQVPREELEGQILLVGASAQGLMDLRSSVLGTILPGVEIHAQVLEQLLSGESLVRPAWAPGLELLVLLVGALMVSAIALRLGALASIALSGALVLSVWGAAWWAFAGPGWLVDPVVPTLTMLVAFVVTSSAHHVRAERRQRWVKQAFSRYVSPNLVNHLVEHPEDLQLSGRRQICSFVFTDLEGFTSLMEAIDPGTAVSMINRYLDGMIAIAFEHQGTLTRIVGDGLAIVFSAPLPQSDHTLRALQCALAMQKFAKAYAEEQNLKDLAFGQTRMGVHAGEVIVGNFGGTTLLDYRALGDPINTAARLEGANRYLGTLVCASQAVLESCPQVNARPIGRLVLKGKKQPIMVFEPLPTDCAPDEAYRAAFELLRDQSDAALGAFSSLAAQRPQDGLVAMHLSRLLRGDRGDLIVLEGK